MLGRALSSSGVSVFLIVISTTCGRKTNCAEKDAYICNVKSLESTTLEKENYDNQANDPISTCTFHPSDLLLTMHGRY